MKYSIGILLICGLMANGIQAQDSIPQTGTFFLESYGSTLAPYPFDPYGGTEPIIVLNATNHVYLIEDTPEDYATLQSFNRSMSRMSMDDLTPDDGGTGGSFYSDSFNYTFDTNLLWLEITNVSGGTVSLNLHNPTNFVYAIWSTTNLLNDWQVETELFPDIYTNILPFTVPTLERQDLFFRAEDWSDAMTNGLYCWWMWKYFHTLDLAATNLDSQGNELGDDYTNNLDPNVISFFISVTNNYVNTAYPVSQMNIQGGWPSYEAILINDTNVCDAVWQPYASSNVVTTLGADGNYNVSIGLRGWPSDATITWQSVSLVKDTIAPLLTLTSPTTETISNSPVSLEGYANEALSELTFDVSNAAGIFTNQQGFLSGQFYDTNLLTITTNWFQCVVDLSDGTNLITLYGMDWAGNATSASFMLNYFNTNPPALAVVWPQSDAAISGSNFTVQAQVDSAAIKIVAAIADSSGNTNIVQGLVEKNGSAWIQNLPLNNGTNNVTVTATGANGSMSVTNFNVVKNDVGLIVYPLDGYQLNQSSVSVYGEIGDTNLCIWVNGVQAYYVDDYGDWEADDVPVSAVGTAALNVQVYIGDPVLVASQSFYQPQPLTVGMMSYSGHHELEFFGSGSDSINWSYLTGGYYNGDEDSFEISSNIDGVAYAYLGDGFVNPVIPFGMPWEYAAVTTPQFYGPWTYSYGNYTQTRVMVEPSGQAQAGTTNLYLVFAYAHEFSSGEMEDAIGAAYGWDYEHLMYGMGTTPNYNGYFGDTPLPPEWLQINGKTLINTGMGADRGATWGETIVSAPAGINWDVTPVASHVYHNQAYTFNVAASDVTPFMLVDANRDGNLDTLTTPNSPYRFWINDSQEHDDDETSGGSNDQIPGSSSPNYGKNIINGNSDLINFFPVALNLANTLQQLQPSDGWEYRLSQADNAVKFVYTSLNTTNAFEYLTNDIYGFGSDSNEWSLYADTFQVTSTGTMLNTNWLAMVLANGGKGVILLEGCAASTAPLMLEFWHKDQNGVDQKIGEAPFYVSISGVEQMFRHLNLCNYGNGEVDVASRASALNEPATENKNLVFLHGYNVNQQQARGVESEMFKRFYWAGSKARFFGVTWNGAVSQGDFIPNVTADYQTNVVNALDTASSLATFLGNLSGQTVVAAHSLGNMVVLSAISDYNAMPSKYFMIDAAVPMEAVQGDTPFESAMVPSTWQNYSNRTFASDWWQLFTSADGRSTLTWSNRLGNLGSVDIYNFYSPGEEVLREDTDDPPSGILDGGVTQLINYWSGVPFGTYAWVWEEKGKGNAAYDTFMSSTHGGWHFPVDQYGDPNPIPPSTANSLSDATLRQVPVFDFNSSVASIYGTFPDVTLTNTDGTASTYAQTYRDRILSDAIPAITLPIGANYMSLLDDRAPARRNFNEQLEFETSWPARSGDEAGKWHHSDFDYVAYPFSHTLFEKIVAEGNLQ